TLCQFLTMQITGRSTPGAGVEPLLADRPCTGPQATGVAPGGLDPDYPADSNRALPTQDRANCQAHRPLRLPLAVAQRMASFCSSSFHSHARPCCAARLPSQCLTTSGNFSELRGKKTPTNQNGSAAAIFSPT